MKRPDESTPGEECALSIFIGSARPTEVCGLGISVDGDWFLGRIGIWWIMGLVDIFDSLPPRLNRAGRRAGVSESSSESKGGEGGSEMSFGESPVFEEAIEVLVEDSPDISVGCVSRSVIFLPLHACL